MFATKPSAQTLLIALSWLTPAVVWAGHVEGFTEPYHDIEMSATGEPGLITAINVQEGQSVRQGDILAELDMEVLQTSLAIARKRAAMQGRIEAAKAEVELRGTRAAKLRKLNQNGHASMAELQRAETDLHVAKANLLIAEEERLLAGLDCRRIEAQIEQRRLRSPIDGVVVEVYREVGESTQVSDPRMLKLVQLDQLRVRFPVSVDHASQVTSSDVVHIQLPEIAANTAAKVELVSPVLDAKSGTVQVTCVIDNRSGKFRSGMRCLMEVEGEGHLEPLDDDFGSELRSLSFDR